VEMGKCGGRKKRRVVSRRKQSTMAAVWRDGSVRIDLLRVDSLF
jgi:hypothetical protein